MSRGSVHRNRCVLAARPDRTGPFAVGVMLVGIWFFRFAPYGDIWVTAGDRGINPWLLVILVLALAVAWLALQLGFMTAGR